MALALLNGTTAAFDFTLAATSGGSPTSIKCIAHSVSLVLRRGSFEQVTFCSSGWRVPTPGFRGGYLHVDGFVATGSAIADPLIQFYVDAACPFVMTMDTGTTMTGSALQTQGALSARAFAEFLTGTDYETSGVVTKVWVVA